MKKTIYFILVAFFIFAGISQLKAQNAVLSSGGNFSNSLVSVSFSVGQVFYTSLNGSEGFVSQGVQQSYEIYLVTGTDELSGISIACEVFPNPTNDFLKLTFNGQIPDNLILKIFDMIGKVLYVSKINSPETTIPMSNYKPGAYLFSIISPDKHQQKTFKIIKN